MALTSRSLILYGFEVNQTNSSLDFKSSVGGPVFQAVLRYGFYSLGGLMNEISRAMSAADPAHLFSIAANRNVSGGLENRVSIATNGVFLSLLFGTGPRVSTSIAPLIGFAASDRIGATTYTGTFSAGIVLIPELVGYNYVGPEMERSVFGALNITASGQKEAIVWAIQQFIEVEFKHEPMAKVITEWRDFMTWAIQQRSFEFTPQIASPSVYYDVTMESTSSDGKGLGYKMAEMLPEFAFFYRTGNFKMRVKT